MNIVELREILRSYGTQYKMQQNKPLIITIEEAYDGPSACEKCKDTRYDLIFMDDEMPGQNGFEATKQITKYQKITGEQRTIVILTGYKTNDK